jgi:hypothetical protein
VLLSLEDNLGVVRFLLKDGILLTDKHPWRRSQDEAFGSWGLDSKEGENG